VHYHLVTLTREDRDLLVRNLSRRLSAAEESGRPAALLDAVVPGLTRELAGILAQQAGDAAAPDVVEAISVLAAVHLGRYRLLPQGQDEDDLWACLNWSAVLLPVAPHLVPEPVRAYLAGPADATAAGANDHGAALYAGYQRTGNTWFLETAIARFREAVEATPDGHPDRPRRLSNLGTALRARFERTGQLADLDQAVAAFRDGAAVLTASPGRRVAAARGWGQCALLAGSPQSAVEGYAAAIELLPLAAWHGLDQRTREHHLREWAELASDAAGAAIIAGHPVRAVELLEAGRSVLWTQALHLLATLWNISDAAAPAMAGTTYAHLLHPDPDHPGPADRPEAARAPFALHRAVTRLHQDRPEEPLIWAPYIHLGP